jgi:virginiamycin A acetyltransferase
MKAIARICFRLLIVPVLIWYRALSLVRSQDHVLEGCSQFLSLVPGVIGNQMRSAFYSAVLEECCHSVTFCFGSILSKVGARIGSHVYIGPYCQIGLVTIGRDTLLGPMVQIPSGPRTHSFDDLSQPIRNQTGTLQRVEIGEDCWLGAGSIVMADIGSKTILGAGSVVTKPIGERVLAAGTPAVAIRERS